MLCLEQVVTVEEHWVKPRSADNNENVLSELAKEELGLSEEQIRKGNPLEHVITKVNTDSTRQFTIYNSCHSFEKPTRQYNRVRGNPKKSNEKKIKRKKRTTLRTSSWGLSRTLDCHCCRHWIHLDPSSLSKLLGVAHILIDNLS